MQHIPFYSLDYVNAYVGENIKLACCDVLNSGLFIRGDYCKKFENAFAAYCKVDYAVGVGNGLDALTLMLRSEIVLHKLNLGDKIIVPANTFVATILAIIAAGLTPILVEPDEFTCNLDVKKMQIAFDSYAGVRAILVVHLYGRLCDMHKICDFAKSKNLLVFEDCAQAHGACLHKNGDAYMAGSFGEAAAFSFYPTKNLGALGDAGIVVTKNANLAQTVNALGNYGFSKKYFSDFVGVNSRLDEIQAAMLLCKLPYLDEWNICRRKVAERYSSGICNPLIRLSQMPTENVSHVWHVFPIFCNLRDELQNFLRMRGIETLIHYPKPPHLQKAFVKNEFCYNALPITESLAKTELSLPMSPSLTHAQIDYIIKTLNSFV